MQTTIKQSNTNWTQSETTIWEKLSSYAADERSILAIKMSFRPKNIRFYGSFNLYELSLENFYFNSVNWDISINIGFSRKLSWFSVN